MTNPFIPKKAFFEKDALKYPLGSRLFEELSSRDVEIQILDPHARLPGAPGKAAQAQYREAKSTLVVRVRRATNFQTCKPSAHYQLPLFAGCPGMCEYCYLATTFGKSPYLRVYVNIEEILGRATEYINQRRPDITVFEAAATSDPIPIERYTGSLFRAVEFFGEQEYGRLRFVTKFADVGKLLTAKHNGHTRFRFSLNTEPLIKKFEHRTPRLEERLAGARAASSAGYPLGFLIAPVIVYDGWEKDYLELFRRVAREVPEESLPGLTLEFVTHRFTKRAKRCILDIFPKTTLSMDEKGRRFKFGQFGYGKYLYPDETLDEIRRSLLQAVHDTIPSARVEYIV